MFGDDTTLHGNFGLFSGSSACDHSRNHGHRTTLTWQRSAVGEKISKMCINANVQQILRVGFLISLNLGQLYANFPTQLSAITSRCCVSLRPVLRSTGSNLPTLDKVRCAMWSEEVHCGSCFQTPRRQIHMRTSRIRWTPTTSTALRIICS